MKIFLQKEDCWDAVVLDASDPISKDWLRMNRKALHNIVLCLENDQLVNVKESESVKDAWLSLKKYHCKSTLSSGIRLMKKLYKAELPKGGDT